MYNVGSVLEIRGRVYFKTLLRNVNVIMVMINVIPRFWIGSDKVLNRFSNSVERKAQEDIKLYTSFEAH